ncbi:MAG TPA: ABC transporter substrate-binding protein [Chloroflexota bacterium]|nr:ABC transporter substrate-binding protein [Chloroflexota bacterium]
MKSISPVLQAVAAMLLLAACGAGAAPASSPVTTSPAASTAKPAASAPANAAAPASVSAKPAASSAASAKPAASGATTGAAIAVKVSNPSPAASMLPYYAALSQGFFKDQGLDVTVVQLASPVAITALSKDEVQFMTVPSDAVTGVTKGLPDRIVYLLWDKAPWVLIGKTSYNSIADLKGKIVAVHPSGSSPEAFLQAGLKSANMTEKDVQVLHLNGTQDIFTAVVAGKADAGVVSPPFDIQAAEQGAHTVAFLGDYLQIPYLGLATSAPYIQQHRDVVVRMIKGLVKGVQYVRDNADASSQLLQQNIGVSPSVAQQTYKEMLPLLTKTGETPVAGVQQTVQLLESVNGSALNVNAAEVIDDGPRKEALGNS